MEPSYTDCGAFLAHGGGEEGYYLRLFKQGLLGPLCHLAYGAPRFETDCNTMWTANNHSRRASKRSRVTRPRSCSSRTFTSLLLPKLDRARVRNPTIAFFCTPLA